MVYRHSRKAGVVMRSWKRKADCYRFCDVRFDDGSYGVCVDEDLIATAADGWWPTAGAPVWFEDRGYLVIAVSPVLEPPVCIADDQERANQRRVWPQELAPAL